ncbi:MAG: hypothetical protein CUN56_11445 [Phototrophicales bacterium]|nr:MAG: hypothetical protein CUN56_11445 [Phototrophicales bacterium]RMG72706.1 MAG: hypothetical protein D6711_12395 [Chloroflexota bacterium]
MTDAEALTNVQIPVQVWIENHSGDLDACDVIVEMEDGMIFTALFVTIPYLQRQMQLTYDLSRQIEDTIPAKFVALDTPHILVDSLDRDSIEDTIDNLLAMEIFESVFTQVTESPTTTTTTTGQRATQEVAAVVLSDVLMVDDN